MLVGLERTAKLILTNALQIRARTVASALTRSIIIHADATEPGKSLQKTEIRL